MKKITAALFLAAISANAAADDFTIGFAKNSIKVDGDKETAKGVSVTYSHFKENSDIGLIVTGSYTGFDENYSTLNNKFNANYDQLSLSAGPIFQINDNISLYGVIGLSHATIDVSLSEYSYDGDIDTYRDNASDTTVNFGGGVRIYPSDKFVINIGFETTKPTYYGETAKANTFTIGAGYKF